MRADKNVNTLEGRKETIKWKSKPSYGWVNKNQAVLCYRPYKVRELKARMRDGTENQSTLKFLQGAVRAPEPLSAISFKSCHYSYTTLAKEWRFHLQENYDREILCFWTPSLAGGRWEAVRNVGCILPKSGRLTKSLQTKLHDTHKHSSQAPPPAQLTKYSQLGLKTLGRRLKGTSLGKFSV